MFRRMNFWSGIGRALLVLALMGLVAAPVAVASVVPAMAEQAMGPMPDGMPCSTAKRPALPDCTKGCLLASLCLTSLASVLGTVSPKLLTRLTIDADLHNGRAVVFSSLIGEPPPRPPKA